MRQPFTLHSSLFTNFIEKHKNDDPAKLRLKYHGKEEAFDVDLAITQIECRKKFGKKLSETLSQHPHFLFPSVLSGEQATSDLLATFHTKILGMEGGSVIDLTAGLGIDALHFLAAGYEVTAVEIEVAKAEALRSNSDGKIEVINGDCTEVIDRLIAEGKRYDVAFIDPARRGTEGQRVFALSDCQPDVLALQPKIARISNRLIVKVSPMLDITLISQSLRNVTDIFALGTPSECKELVAICDNNETGNRDNNQAANCNDDNSTEHGDKTPQLTIHAVTLCPEPVDFAFTPQMEREARATYSAPCVGGYIYEPYPTVMKAAPFDLLSDRFGIDKLHPNTHLYWSMRRVEGFPGQCLPIVQVLPYASKHIKRLHRDYPALQVATRNFDITADTLRRKLSVRDSNTHRLFGTTLHDSSPALIITTLPIVPPQTNCATSQGSTIPHLIEFSRKNFV